MIIQGVDSSEPVSRSYLPYVLLFLVPVVLYVKSIGFSFIESWDDANYIIDNPFVRTLSRENLAAMFGTDIMSNYAPLHLLSYAVGYQLWGDSPAGYHAVNVVVHAANACLAYRLLRETTSDDRIAFWAALLFAVHPVNAENVAWISESKTLLIYGLGVWGVNQPVGWGFDIVNFVFWVGIGHAGTLISAILFLMRQRWRTGIARFAEAMTIFAVMCAGLFPLLHTGRQWLPLYLTPYPNQHGLWVNFTSPLLWDVFAVSTYFTVSLVFWYIGLIPDFASLRDRTDNKIKKIVYSIFSLGWRHSNRHWQHYERAYLILAGFATPLVLSVHTIVSFDFQCLIQIS